MVRTMGAVYATDEFTRRPRVLAVHLCAEHRFSKRTQPSIRLLAGLGVEGDAHLGVTVQHLSRVRKDPTKPNLRQVHLIRAELLEELGAAGFEVGPGELGENLTTRGLDLLALPAGTCLRIGTAAVVEVTGLRNPCLQIDAFRKGLLKQVVHPDGAGGVVRRAGVMGVVRAGGTVCPGDVIEVELPPPPHRVLDCV
jgi:MOSC domain-containing protein YiiM